MNPFEAQLARLSIHYIGNKANGGELVLSQQEHSGIANDLETLLWKYFIDNIDQNQLFQIGASGDQVKSSIQLIFSNPESFHSEGIKLATRLYDVTDTSNLGEGDFFLAYFKNMQFEDEVLDAIGIFRCEQKDDYIKTVYDSTKHSIISDKGINIKKLDKGCLIYNTDAHDGYRIRIHQQSGQGIQSRFWIESFLGLDSVSNEYHHTNHYLKLTKDFVTKRLPEDKTISKADQIDYLNRSMDYFKANDRFDNEEFAKEIFTTPETQSAFNSFRNAYTVQKDIDLAEDFPISQNAIDKNKRVYRSVLKLDKNFHVYIHGDRSLIEKGSEPNGRKYYKIFYNEES